MTTATTTPTKTVKVRYTYVVTTSVPIRQDNCPSHYSPEEWEKQQLEDVGYDNEPANGKVEWFYQQEDGK